MNPKDFQIIFLYCIKDQKRENLLVDLKIKALLNLQEYDIERLKIESQLRMFPEDVLAINSRIDEVKALEQSTQNELKQFELKRNDLDRQLNEAEERVRKFKTQQISVKKNEEYEALSKTIEREEALVNQLADDQLELLVEIDELRKKAEVTLQEYREQKQGYDTQINYLKKQEIELKANLQKLQASVAEAEKSVDPIYLKKYHQVLKQVKRGPYVVQLEGNRCHGCHLTVSNEIVSLVRQGNQPSQCDSCSRILYLAD